ncbi:MAG: copper chaperone [Myxacorys californica WJT36-NPBG1]|jgi:copper chaperone|nr:copper chaperone [Myxacorys californica WJT36-NPBG1]
MSITKAIQAIDERAIVDADPKTKLVKVKTPTSEAAIKAAVTDAGYTVTGYTAA